MSRSESTKEPPKPRMSLYALLSSLIALAISISSFYSSYFHKVDKLEIFVDAVQQHSRSLPIRTLSRMVLINSGNRTVTILSVQLGFGTTRQDQLPNGPKPDHGPLVLKPGDAAPLELNASLTEQILTKLNGPEASLASEKRSRVRLYAFIEAIGSVGNRGGAFLTLGEFEFEGTERGWQFLQLDTDKLQRLI